MTKDEILALPSKPEEEQRLYLIAHGLLEPIHEMTESSPYESLADCAFRLRDEVGVSYNSMVLVYELNGGDGDLADWWFGRKAKPIHWICAALLAREQG